MHYEITEQKGTFCCIKNAQIAKKLFFSSYTEKKVQNKNKKKMQ